VVSLLRKDKALSQIVSTLLLLIVAVLLAAVSTYYATNITKTRTENEQILLGKAHVWVNSTGAIAAIKMQNLGGKDILLDKISVRGVESSWSDVFIYRIPSGTSITDDLTVCNYSDMVGGFTHDGEIYSPVSSDIPFTSGSELLVYIKDPDNIQIDDIGSPVSISITTNNAQYKTEVNVESATTQ
jgi:hypothetical protein